MTFSSGSQCFRLDNVDLVHGIPEIVENAFKKFNADEAVKKMMAAPSWPRQPYIKKDGKAYSVINIS